MSFVKIMPQFIHNTRYVIIHQSINMHKKGYFWLRLSCKLKTALGMANI